MKAKNIFIGFLLLLIMSFSVKAQIRSNLSSNLSAKTTHEERIESLHEARMNYLLKNLNLKNNQEEGFKNVYKEYEKSRSEIFKDFKQKFGKKDLTEEETREKIYEGFDLSEKLLENQRAYADKFLQVISAVQLDNMFRLEKLIGMSIMQKRQEKANKK